MYICICNALNDTTIKNAAAEPDVKSAAGVFNHCGTRSRCGQCVPDIQELLASVSAQSTGNSISPD